MANKFDVALSLPIVSFDGDEDDLDDKIMNEWVLQDSDGNEVAIIGVGIQEIPDEPGDEVDAPHVS